MNTQNRVTTASRAAAGFGATNIDPSDSQVISNTLNNMSLVVLNTVTETLDLSPELWDIWSIYAQTKISSTSPVTVTFTVFTDTHVYGNHNVVSTAEWATLVQDVRGDIRQAILEECTVNPNCTGDIKVVASVPFYNLDTILGLPIWQWTGFRTVRGLTVMRIGERALNTGCPLIPIAVHLGQYSLYPSDWTCGHGDPNPPCDVTLWRGPWNAGTTWFNQDPVYKFPTNFDSTPTPLPYMNNITNTLVLSTTNYKDNVPGVPLQMAQGSSGNIYTATLGTGPGSFGWITWDGSNPSLTYPGDFRNKYPGSNSDLNDGDGDGVLEIGEWVQDASPISIGGFQAYIDDELKPAIIIYENKIGSKYQVYGFANIEILGFNSSKDWILFRIVQWPSEQCIPPTPAYTGP